MQQTPKREIWIKALVVVTTMSLTGYYLSSGYQSRKQPHDSLRLQCYRDAGRQATNLSFFYRERLLDVETLARHSIIQSYFINRALGMSPQHGLQGTMLNITALLRRLITEQKSLRSFPVYRRFLLSDENGATLADTDPRDPAAGRHQPAGITPTSRETVEVCANSAAAGGEVIIRVPVHFKDTRAGQLLAWLDYRAINRQLVGGGDDDRHRIGLLTADGTDFSGADQPLPVGIVTAGRIWTIDPNIKIVIVTAYHEYAPEDIVQITGRQDLLYVNKPFNHEEIRQLARALLNQWNLEAEHQLLCKQLENSNTRLREFSHDLEGYRSGPEYRLRHRHPAWRFHRRRQHRRGGNVVHHTTSGQTGGKRENRRGTERTGGTGRTGGTERTQGRK